MGSRSSLCNNSGTAIGGALRRRDLAWANANSCAASGLAELDPPYVSQSVMVILEGGALRRRDLIKQMETCQTISAHINLWPCHLAVQFASIRFICHQLNDRIVRQF